ncbi:DUF4340 domain-containing protein [Engelhardtia mirabilis]|uniref:DUF4340 domain-containing protein n=1 Tax=Engelhardtia mirabilis TaxID=2528011 RepID=A0A518BJS1_9BACT|nr:hypothetical protein Pla133_22960 [Planctomycetes bacterium Pla133]QDV01545.1 hypothetical protein Pla86_22960 [Planctomycetes bacterium Pla86]
MHLRTTLALLLVVLALGALAWWGGDGQETDPIAQLDRPLFSGLESSRVVGLRVDFTDRELTLELERGPSGSWSLIAPVSFAADPGPVKHLLDLVTRSRAELAPLMTPDAVGLDPGVVEIEVIESLADGSTRSRSIQLGETDFDGAQVFATIRAGGADDELADAVYRVPRALLTAVDLPLVEWRERRLLQASSRDVIVFRRRGSLPEMDGSFDPAFAGELDLDFELAANQFYATAPYRARLHPSAVEPLRLAIAGARARRFLADDTSDLRPFGLEPPAFTIEVELRDGVRQRVLFGVMPDPGADPADRRWTALVEGRPVVYELNPVDVRILSAPVDQLLDYDVINVLATGVFGLELRVDGAEVGLERDNLGWTVADSAATGDEPRRADEGAVADLLGEVLSAEVAAFLTEPEQREQPVTGRVSVRLEGGEEIGADVGPRIEYRGLEGRLVRRDGEDLWGLVTVDLDGLATTDQSSLLSAYVFRLDELNQATIELAGDERSATWRRDPQQGLWSRAGASGEDREFALQVESILAPRVRRWLEVDSGAVMESALSVEIVDRAGRSQTYELGRMAVGGESLSVVRAGVRTGEIAPRLTETLVDLLAR